MLMKKYLLLELLPFINVKHFSNSNYLVLDLATPQAHPNMGDFQHNNPPNSTYLYSFLSFSHKIRPTTYTGKIINRFDAHPLSERDGAYISAVDYLFFHSF